MAMTMTGEVQLPAPRQTVWEKLNDPEVLKATIPGCESLEKTSDTSFQAVAVTKIGPVKAKWKGKINLTDLDPPNGYKIVGEVALPICEAVAAHRQGDYRGALDRMRPVLPDMHLLGGSHAQQDVLMQLFLDSAVKADCAADVRLILDHARRAGFELDKRAGYAQAVRQFVH